MLAHGALKCEKCGSNSYLNAHHIYGKKAYPAGKYMLDNGVLVCAGCHFIAHHKSEEFRFWLIGYLGDGDAAKGEREMHDLLTRVRAVFQFRRHDEQLVKDLMEKSLEKYRTQEPQA